MQTSRLGLLAAALGAFAANAAAQTAISAKAGLINHLQGEATLDGKAVVVKPTKFVEIGKGSEFATSEGLAEVLLGPGMVLRVGEHSAFRMISNDVTDTRLALRSGSMILENAGEEKDASATVLVGDSTVTVSKKGVYRIDTDPARMMVYDGQASVQRDGQFQNVKKSRLLALEGVSVPEKFDNKNGDSLFRWARRRAEYLSVANVSAATSMSGLGFSPAGSQGWIFNPYLGMFTYLPYSGYYSSFWGYGYWSPATVYDAYYDPRFRRAWNSGGGAVGQPSGTGSGSSTGSKPSGSTPATSANQARGSAAGGGRTIPAPRPAMGSGASSSRPSMSMPRGPSSAPGPRR